MPHGRAKGAKGEFAAYSGYLNKHGLLCTQCDGANVLFANFLSLVFRDDPHIQVRDETCVVRGPFTSRLTKKDAHARTHIYFKGQRVAVLDVTPNLWDVLGLLRGNVPAEIVADADKVEAERAEFARVDPTQRLREEQLKLLERIHKLRAYLIARASVRRAFLASNDPTRPVPRGLLLSHEFGVTLEEMAALRSVVNEARRYRGYLLRSVQRDPASGTVGLEEDRIALAELDRLFQEMASAEKFCAEELTETRVTSLPSPPLNK